MPSKIQPVSQEVQRLTVAELLQQMRMIKMDKLREELEARDKSDPVAVLVFQQVIQGALKR